MPTGDEIPLPVDVTTWLRENGWHHGRVRYADCRHEWRRQESHATVIVEVHDSGVESTVYRADSALAYTGWPESVSELVDVLCALGVLPVEFSSAYQAGVESIPWHYGVRREHGELRRFREDVAGAVAYAAPAEKSGQLTVVRWRRGPEETAVIPDANA